MLFYNASLIIMVIGTHAYLLHEYSYLFTGNYKTYVALIEAFSGILLLYNFLVLVFCGGRSRHIGCLFFFYTYLLFIGILAGFFINIAFYNKYKKASKSISTIYVSSDALTYKTFMWL
jgi:hypothetical protein